MNLYSLGLGRQLLQRQAGGGTCSHCSRRQPLFEFQASDWGGTALSQWTPADAVADCAITRNCTCKGWIGGDHYNAMVHPFTVGPMTLSGFAWYQGENGAGGPVGAAGPCITMPTDPKSVDPIWAP